MKAAKRSNVSKISPALHSFTWSQHHELRLRLPGAMQKLYFWLLLPKYSRDQLIVEKGGSKKDGISFKVYLALSASAIVRSNTFFMRDSITSTDHYRHC
jgi:hypothetical protein